MSNIQTPMHKGSQSWEGGVDSNVDWFRSVKQGPFGKHSLNNYDFQLEYNLLKRIIYSLDIIGNPIPSL